MWKPSSLEIFYGENNFFSLKSQTEMGKVKLGSVDVSWEANDFEEMDANIGLGRDLLSILMPICVLFLFLHLKLWSLLVDFTSRVAKVTVWIRQLGERLVNSGGLIMVSDVYLRSTIANCVCQGEG